LDRFHDTDSVAVDNIRVCGGGSCTVDPWITSHPQNLTVCNTLQADFYVTAIGTEPISYQWYYEGSEILGAGSTHYWIYPVSPSDEGEYKVRVANAVDTVFSSSAFLSVSTLANSPLIAYSPRDTVVNNGDHVRFEAGAIGTPQLSYQWYLDGNPISGATDTTHTVYFAGLADEGGYQMMATDGCGSTRLSDPGDLVVNTSCSLSLLSSQEACVGNPVTFSITATGSPPFTYQWHNTNGLISGATASSYTISSVTMADDMDYWVVVTNPLGSATSTVAHLTVFLNSITVPDPVYGIHTIQAALDLICPNGGVITLTDGLYQGVGNRNVDFLGKNPLVMSQSGDPKLCIVDCGYWARGFNFRSGETAAATLDGITIRNGNPGTYDYGGAIYIAGASPTIINCIMENCLAWHGGAIAASGFWGTIQNCTFSMNTASSCGGAVYLYGYSEPIGGIGNCTFFGNSAFHGGGICLDEYASLSTLTHSILAWNSGGKAVVCLSSSAVYNVYCSDVYQNVDGNWQDCIAPWAPPTNYNIQANPHFCDIGVSDYTLADISPCAPANSLCGQLIGAWPVGCWPSADDDGVMEYGIEWIKNYRYADDLECCKTTNDHFVATMSTAGWTEGFNNKDGSADLDHWGSENNSYVDAVDLSLFCGHGVFTYDLPFDADLHGILFRENKYEVPLPDYCMTPGSAEDCWGDGDAEWIALGACETLSDDDGSYWAAAFDGAHLILGYHTDAYGSSDIPWINQMVSVGPGDPAKRIGWAWCKGCDAVKTCGTTARVLGESVDMKYDYIWGQGLGPQQDPDVDANYSHWDHTKGQAHSMPELATRGLVRNMSYYEVIPPTYDYDDVEYLASLFGIFGPVEDYGDGNFYVEDGPKYLIVNQTAGIDYGHLGKLWLPHATAPSLPTLEEAGAIAEGFLNASGLQAHDRESGLTVIYSDVQSLRDKATGDVVEGQEYPTDIQVSYRRELNGFPVVGGDGLLAYVGEGGGEISGMTKTWRELNDQGSVSLLDTAEALDYFHAYGAKLMPSSPIMAYDSLEVLAVAQAYYEPGFGVAADYVYPVYLINCQLFSDGDPLNEFIFYVPAATQFMPLIADITAPPVDCILVLGENAAFAGEGVFGSTPYTYSWDSDLDGFMSSSASFSYSSLALGEHIISLQIWDSGGETAAEWIDVLVTDQVDFGDAPDPGYPTLLASNGARHVNDGLTYLGAAIDNELDGQPDATATGDDGDGGADEDGVIFTSAVSNGSTADVTVTASTTGYLNAWVDFNHDLDWDEPDEQIFSNTSLVAGANLLGFAVPSDAVQDTTFARFRFDTRGGLSYTGIAPDGEVEDYLVTIGCQVDSLEGCLPENEPCGLRLNNGCNLEPPVFIPIEDGITYCAESWADTNWRDSDWYELEVDEPALLQFSFRSEIEMFFGLIAQTEPGVEGCDNLLGYAEPWAQVPGCVDSSLTADLPAAGHYYLIAFPPVWEGFPCSGGPYMYHFGVELLGTQPVVYISLDAGNIILNWESVVGAEYYKVYSATEAYADFPTNWTLETPVPPGVVDTTWSEPHSGAQKFYRVLAVSEDLLAGETIPPRYELGFEDRAPVTGKARPVRKMR